MSETKYDAAATRLGVHRGIAHAAETMREVRRILEALNASAAIDGAEEPFMPDCVFPTAVEEALRGTGRPAKVVMAIIRMIDQPREMRDGDGKPLYGTAFEINVLAPDTMPIALLKSCAGAITQKANAMSEDNCCGVATIAVGSEAEAREILSQIGTACDPFEGKPRGNGDEAEGC